ncbi:molecular chaperone [Burkholderia sp. GS2Y]|uniref:Molecular chaperone n=1 Tax=Burkholderia theae TaxID=3143496 RepID=A0ABU9WAV6_9BURK
MKTSLIAGLALAGSLFCTAGVSHAGIMLDGTRLVLAAPAKEASILVKNKAPTDIMIQSWVEAGSQNGDVPFAITPALSRLSGEKQQMLRILYQGQGLPTDRESVFWVNVQEVPQKAKDENTLQIAVRQRIKLFYRPVGLPGKPEGAAAQLSWRVVNESGAPRLEARNGSAYHVSLSSVTLRSGGRDYSAKVEMIPPSATRRFELQGWRGQPDAGAKVQFESINDFGATESHSSPVVD